MAITSLFSHQPSKDYMFICLLLTDASVQAFLIDVSSGDVVVKTKSSVAVFSSEEQAVIKTDEVLQDLGSESEKINEVAFGFEDAWMVSGDLRDDKKPLLQKISADLSLTPIGFVVLSEAVIEQLSIQDSYFSGFIFSFGQAGLTCSLLLKGSLMGTEHIGLSDDLQMDVAEGFARFAQIINSDQNFPNKIIITSMSFDRASLLEVEQSLLEFDWATQPKFLQIPEIILLQQEEMAGYVIHQLVYAVAQSKGFSVGQSFEKTLEESDTDLADGEEFGFQTMEMHTDNTVLTAEPDPELIPTSFGIPIKQEDLGKFTGEAGNDRNDVVRAPDSVKDSQSMEKKDSIFSSFFKKKSSKKPSQVAVSTTKKVMSLKQSVFIGVSTGFLASCFIAYMYLLHIAVVTAHIELVTKPVAKEVAITLDSENNISDPKNLKLAANTVTKQVSKTDFVQTTGTGLDGEKAKGVVTLFNKTTSQKKFPKGTQLKSGTLLFTLDDDVEIASASVIQKDGGEEKEYGKIETNISASEIGAEANLEKDTNLTIESFATSSYEGKVLSGLSGGASREFQTVAEADVSSVLKNVRQLIKSEAKDLFKDDVKNGVYYIVSEDIELINQEFDAKVGDEADVLELSATAEVSALAYNTKDLRPLASSVLGAAVPEGFELGDADPEILSLPKKASGSATSSQQIVANISSIAKPVVNTQDLLAVIANKKIMDAQQALQSQKEITSVQFTFKPQLAKYVLTNIPDKQEKVVFDLK